MNIGWAEPSSSVGNARARMVHRLQADLHNLAVSEPCRRVVMAASAVPRAFNAAEAEDFPMINQVYDIGIARQIGTYSDAVLAPAGARWLFTAGTPGLEADGNLPDDITGQAEIAWGHIMTMLAQAGMNLHDVVKVTQYLRREADIPAYAKVRARFLGDARPASMLMVVAGLVRPEFLLEIEVCAAKA